MAAQEGMLDDPEYRRLEQDLFGGPAGFPRMAMLLIHTYVTVGQLEEAGALLQRISKRALPPARMEIGVTAMVLHFLQGHLAEAADGCARAVDGAVQLRDYASAVVAAWDETLVRVVGPAERPEELDQAAQRLRELEYRAWRLTGYSRLGRGFSLTGVYDFFRGDWQSAYHNLVEAVRSSPAAMEGTLAYYAGRVLLISGAPEEARPFFESLAPMEPDEPFAITSNLMVLVHALRVELYTALGNEARARAWMEAALRWPALNAAPFFRANVRLACAVYYQAFGDPVRARQEAEMALQDAEAVRSSLTLMEAHRKLGELAALVQDRNTARAHFEHAMALAERCQFPFELALIRLSRSTWLGGTAEAEAEMREVCAYFERIGATPALAMARKRLEAAARGSDRAGTLSASAARGVSVGRPDGGLVEGLTDKEREVLMLMAAGMPSRVIAKHLGISLGTVKTHIHHIYQKLTVSDRWSAIEWARKNLGV
ncbi:helix-turn-helix transcriptional regulator [Alicyclobacillus macrosporangiidus]|uniref:helix-turn-helix transcriptional regulator n=1 Tax=Alicyclobacillus macrosporangiidus TaxID=392015 RepID=UPI000A3EBF77